MQNELPKDYVFVSERIEAFHQKFQNGSIKTCFIKKGGLSYFIAKVIPDMDVPERYFTGSSFGDLSEDKAFEKLETSAIGRALNIAGLETKMAVEKNEVIIESELSKSKSIATVNQIDLIEKKITKKGITLEQLNQYIQEEYEVENLGRLNKIQASTLIIELNDEQQVETIRKY
jgi:hypothetical protein